MSNYFSTIRIEGLIGKTFRIFECFSQIIQSKQKIDNKNQKKTIDNNSLIFSDTKFQIARVRKSDKKETPDIKIKNSKFSYAPKM